MMGAANLNPGDDIRHFLDHDSFQTADATAPSMTVGGGILDVDMGDIMTQLDSHVTDGANNQ